MEVYDQLKQSGGDGKNTTRAQKLMIMHSQCYLPEVGSFFSELKLWGTFSHCLGLIFNELELHTKNACSYHIIRMSHR